MMKSIEASQISVVKGNPTAEELDALASALNDMLRQRAEAAVPADRNLWGYEASPLHPQALFNPHAFDSAAYF